MSNPVGTKASREEEAAFLAIERVLDVDITLGDDGGGNKMPDGSWIYPHGQGRRGIVEITSPPATDLLRRWAHAKRAGEPQVESGSFPVRLNELAKVFTEMLATPWAIDNFNKLLAQPADERHLFLFARRHEEGTYFYRLSEPMLSGIEEELGELTLPEGISDVWFRGRTSASISDTEPARLLRVARYQAGSGWSRHSVRIDERQLPTPNPDIADEDALNGSRYPKNRAGRSVTD
jgi:hypothetical protein